MPTIYLRAFFGVFTLLKESIYGSVQYLEKYPQSPP